MVLDREPGPPLVPTSRVVAFRRLPPGYGQDFSRPPATPVEPRPAATVTLLREGTGGLEVLLLKRSHRTRFIPGAYVFPGGRVEPADRSQAARGRVDGIAPEEADRRLGISDGDPPGIAFWVAALRETFEETGILLVSDPRECRSVPSCGHDEEGRLRAGLHGGRMAFPQILDLMETTLAGGRLAYVGHWVTPVVERYRYDTRFFAVEIPPACPVFPDGVELVDHLWIAPSRALRRNEEGHLPMVFPTILTLESLTAFEAPSEAIQALAGREIPRLLPRVEEQEDGVRMTL